MIRAAWLAVVLAAVPGVAAARRAAHRSPHASVILAGERIPVRWIDGDTFRIEGGRFQGRSARLVGVNALESYGPVHRFAAMSPRALLAIAKGSAPLAASRERRCETDGRPDVYGRLLVECPDAAEALVAAGYAMVFAVDAPSDPALLAAQRAAQAARAGMWAGGVPPLVPTSLHSVGEAGLGPRGAYDRVVDTAAGVAEARPHARRYSTCEEVCVGAGAGLACMRYVPFERRYRGRPWCLR